MGGFREKAPERRLSVLGYYSDHYFGYYLASRLWLIFQAATTSIERRSPSPRIGTGPGRHPDLLAVSPGILTSHYAL